MEKRLIFLQCFLKIMKKWPKDPTECVSFSELVDSLLKALRKGYKLERINEGKDIPYKGYDIGYKDQAVNPNAEEFLKAETLEYFSEKGRELDFIIIEIAILLGIEQWRRLVRKELQLETQILELCAKSLTESLERIKGVK